jgi:hypothetical protein
MTRENTEQRVLGTYSVFSPLERQEIDAAKSHLFTPTPGPPSEEIRRRCTCRDMMSTDESKGLAGA